MSMNAPAGSRNHALHIQIRHVVLFTALFSFLAHGYRYFSPTFSGDSMLLSQVGEELYQISLGRFLQPVYWQIRGYITVPFLIGLFATAFLCASSLIVVRLFSLEHPVHIALVCGILSANETLAISNATYLPWTDVYMLALLLCFTGVHLSRRMRLGWLLSPILYSLSLGLYQSYLPAAATLVILLLISDTLRGRAAGEIWQEGLLACVSLVLGLLLYAAVLALVLRFTGAQASQDYNGVGNVSLLSPEQIPALLKTTCMTPLKLLFGPTDAPVMTWHITTVPAALNIAIFGLAMIMLITRAASLRPASLLTLAFLLAVLPLGMNFIQFIAKGTASGLTIYAYNLAYLLPVILPAKDAQAPLLSRVLRISRSSACVLLAVFLALCTRNSNTMALKRDLEYSATTAAVSRILDQAERTPGYIPGETPVVLIGMLPASTISMERPGFEQIAKVQGMRYTYAASYETANYWYLEMMLGESMNLVSHEERKQFYLHPDVQALPLYPHEDCCRMLDGYLIIRIS